MEMQIEKIGLIRLKNNPRSQELNLNVDWVLEYIHKSPYKLEYIGNIKTFNPFPSNLKIEGNLNLNSPDEFEEEKVSKVIVDVCLEMLLNMINVTKEHNFELNSDGNFIKTKLAIQECINK